MCGICGELKFDGGQPDLQAVTRMMDKLARRGPDPGGAPGRDPRLDGGSCDPPAVDEALGAGMRAARAIVATTALGGTA